MTFLKTAPVETSIKDRVISRVEWARERGVDLDDAVKEAYEFIKSERLVMELFDEVGMTIVRDLWWRREQTLRRQALVTPTTPVRAYVQMKGQRTSSDFMERAWGTGGIKIGDFDAKACDEVIATESGIARGHYRTVKFFRNVRRGLNGKVVREAYTNAELVGLAIAAGMVVDK